MMKPFQLNKQMARQPGCVSMTSKTQQQEQIEKVFLEELQALLDKYKVDIIAKECSSGYTRYVEGIELSFDAIYGDETNNWQVIRPYWDTLHYSTLPYNR